MSEANKQLSRRFTELFSTDDPALADTVLAPDIVFHGLGGGDVRGVEATKAFIAAYRAAFPDAVSTVEEQVAEGDRVATRWRARGTHRGPLADVEASGRRVDFEGVTIERIVDGRIAEVWVVRDELSMLRQVGAIRDPGPAVPA